MPLLETEPMTQSSTPLIFRTILITVLSIAILVSATANIYFYYKNESLGEKMNALQEDVQSIKKNVGGASVDDDLERQIKSVSAKLDDIGDDVSSIESNIRNIESDVSSIQIKIGY